MDREINKERVRDRETEQQKTLQSQKRKWQTGKE